jgi:two-component system OmpR family sensor kinase
MTFAAGFSQCRSSMRSLQRTLTLRYAATMLAALLLIGLWAYLGVRATLESELDRALADAATIMVDVVASGEPLTAHMGASDLSGILTEGERLVVTRDSAGRILASNSSLGAELPLDTAAMIVARTGARGWANTHWAEHDFRTIYQPGSRDEAATGVAVVQVAVSVVPLFHATNSILVRIVATVLLGTLVTGVGAAWLARSSLKPVADVAAQARSIHSRGGLQRITVHADVLELQSLIEVLNGMLARLDNALNAQRRIIRDVGHELRTPITAMRGEVEIALHRERRPEEYRSLLSSILEEVDRLGLMGEQLIFLTRFESGDVELRREPVELADLVRTVTRQLGRRLHGHPVRLDALSPHAGIDADRRLLGLALEQLLDNVIRHTPEGTEVRLGVGDAPDQVTLSVEDAGPGVPEELLPHLFAPFLLLDPARSRTGAGGVGLGLAMFAAIIELHGGKASASRSPSGGLRVVMTFPRR